MEHLSLQRSGRMAQNWLDDHMKDSLASAPEEERRLLETLYARQKGSLEYLSLIQLDMGKPAKETEDVKPEKWLRVVCHGSMDLLLPVVTLAFVLLDWELAGMGDREFDIAWAMLRRPGQRFMVRAEEYEAFLEGYRRLGAYDVQRLRYYLACAMMCFAAIGADDAAYHQWIRAGLAALCQP